MTSDSPRCSRILEEFGSNEQIAIPYGCLGTRNGLSMIEMKTPQPQLVGFRNLLGVAIARVSKITAVKYRSKNVKVRIIQSIIPISSYGQKMKRKLSLEQLCAQFKFPILAFWQHF